MSPPTVSRPGRRMQVPALFFPNEGSLSPGTGLTPNTPGPGGKTPRGGSPWGSSFALPTPPSARPPRAPANDDLPPPVITPDAPPPAPLFAMRKRQQTQYPIAIPDRIEDKDFHVPAPAPEGARFDASVLEDPVSKTRIKLTVKGVVSRLREDVSRFTSFVIEMDKLSHGDLTKGVLPRRHIKSCLSLAGMVIADHQLDEFLEMAGFPPEEDTIPYPKLIRWVIHGDFLAAKDLSDINDIRYAMRAKHRNLIRAFQAFDLENNRILTIDELTLGLSTLGLQLSRMDLTYVAQQCDTNRDGRVDYREFLKFFYKKQTEAELTDIQICSGLMMVKYKSLMQCFKAWDFRNNGLVAYDELVNGLKGLGTGFADNRLRRIARTVDMRKKGAASYRDFVEVFSTRSKTLQQHIGDLLVSRFGTLHHAFPHFRRSGKAGGYGKLTGDVFRQCLAGLELGLTKSEVDQVYVELDSFSGVIDVKDFVRAFEDEDTRAGRFMLKLREYIQRRFGSLQKGYDLLNETKKRPTVTKGGPGQIMLSSKFLSVQELLKAIIAWGFDEPLSHDLCRRIDEDANGVVEPSEWDMYFCSAGERLALFRQDLICTLQYMWPTAAEAFAYFDDDGGGAVEVGELRRGLRSLDLSATEAELNTVLRAIGIGFATEIGLTEFTKLYEGSFETADSTEEPQRHWAIVEVKTDPRFLVAPVKPTVAPPPEPETKYTKSTASWDAVLAAPSVKVASVPLKAPSRPCGMFDLGALTGLPPATVLTSNLAAVRAALKYSGHGGLHGHGLSVEVPMDRVLEVLNSVNLGLSRLELSKIASGATVASGEVSVEQLMVALTEQVHAQTWLEEAETASVQNFQQKKQKLEGTRSPSPRRSPVHSRPPPRTAAGGWPGAHRPLPGGVGYAAINTGIGVSAGLVTSPLPTARRHATSSRPHTTRPEATRPDTTRPATTRPAQFRTAKSAVNVMLRQTSVASAVGDGSSPRSATALHAVRPSTSAPATHRSSRRDDDALERSVRNVHRTRKLIHELLTLKLLQ
eukprot:CAMPEP_0114541428 /NCGR_PEP_ID=MMETSP0114-20121206/1299_1 /TAXON_ID=31324 /ORGANISM="Goniomonas sp, Strain m" /LENGTH=1030 /DNA_ID=CAMNT_0001725663 /DNA_START=44 /DNA_END=3136 /DNA_ORIENTATION=-